MMAEEETTGDVEPDQESTDKGTSDTDWLTAEDIQTSERTRDRHRRSRVRRTPANDGDGAADLDIDVDDLDAMQDQLGDLSDDAFADMPEETEDVGVPLGKAGRLLVTVDESGDAAFVNLLDFGGDKGLLAKDIQQVMEENFDIRFGLDEDALGKLVATARNGTRIEGSHIVANSRPAKKGKDGEVRCLFLLEEGEDLVPSYLELQPAMAKPELQEALNHCPLACLVAAGDRIAELVPPTDGEPGVDVYGDTQVEAGSPTEVKLGPNVAVSPDDPNVYCAEILGYVYYLRGVLAVVPPIWIDKEKTEASFIHFRPVGRRPTITSEDLLAVMEKLEIRHGIQEATIERLCSFDLGTEPQAFLLARGVEAVNGTDAHVDYVLDTEPKPGTFLPDGTIDLKQRNTVITVKEGDYLGQLVAAVPGRNGMTVTGQEIEARDGEKRPFKPGRNVRVEETDDGPKFYAEIEGSVRAKIDSLAVAKILQVEGDIDYGVGNVDTTADIEISGSVKSGFQIKSSGSVVIAGVVEEGARVQAGGDVVVAGGIIGERTRIVAHGTVEAKFIQNSMVLAQGDVNIGAYIYNAHVRCGGAITVTATAESSILGGEVVSAKGIEAGRLGSEKSDRTLVGIRGAPGAEAGLEKASKFVKACDMAVIKMLRALGVAKVNMAALRQCLARTPAAKRPQVADQIRKLQELVGKRQIAVEKQQELAHQIADELAKSTITGAEIFPDVMIQIGEQVHNVPKKLANVTFFRGDEGIESRG